MSRALCVNHVVPLKQAIKCIHCGIIWSSCPQGDLPDRLGAPKCNVRAVTHLSLNCARQESIHMWQPGIIPGCSLVDAERYSGVLFVTLYTLSVVAGSRCPLGPLTR